MSATNMCVHRPRYHHVALEPHMRHFKSYTNIILLNLTYRRNHFRDTWCYMIGWWTYFVTDTSLPGLAGAAGNWTSRTTTPLIVEPLLPLKWYGLPPWMLVPLPSMRRFRGFGRDVISRCSGGEGEQRIDLFSDREVSRPCQSR